MTPRIAIVVPVYRHSALASEAIASALDQPGSPGHVVIAVDDGCPNPETRQMLEGWTALHPGRVHRLHQANRGLSGARNTGIAFALDRYPSVEAILPLDADNRLDPDALALFARLLDRHPEADWFYPNFDMFGLESHAHNGCPFNLALMAESNHCEAGSLVRRRVFEAGVRYDETMRAGYEDWEFWLSAARTGFRGHPVRGTYLRYRKRPESMLSGSHEQDTILRAAIRARHPWLYNGDRIAREAAKATPRYVLVEADRLSTGTTAFTETTAEAVTRAHQAANARPGQAPRPMAWVFARPGLLAALAGRKLQASVLAQLHDLLAEAPVAAARIARHPDGQRRLEATPPRIHPSQKPRRKPATRRDRVVWDEAFAGILAEEAALRDEADILLLAPESLDTDLSRARIAELSIELEDPPERTGPPPAETLAKWQKRLEDPARAAYLAQLAPWREDPKVSGPANLDWVIRHNTLGGIPLPFERTADLHIGFVLPIFLFGGVEKCAVALATALRERGVKSHLFVYGTEPMTQADWLTAPWETIHQVTDKALRDWRGPRYLGTNLAAEPPEALMRRILAPLTGMDAVILTGSAALLHGLSALRGKGIATLSWEHLLETSGYGRPYGTPYLATAYEGGLDLILTCSDRLAHWLHGQGVPRDKLLALPNGPGFPMTEEARAEALETRANRDPNAPLRVGFLGRLDNQKGADRFLALAQACAHLPVEFSITGGAVLGADRLEIPESITRHPPAYGIDELNAAFARLDVLAMPSRDEGLPLTIMEAQRAGVIPLATDVGAVSEAIEDGETGFLVKGDPVAQMTRLVTRLSEDPTLRARISGKAATRDGQWSRNAETLETALRKLLRR